MVYYNGAHSITFINPLCGDIENGLYPEYQYSKNSWKDWGLIPSNKPIISLPLRKTNMLEILGGREQKDISLDFFKRPFFSNREGSLEFILINENIDSSKKYKNFNDVIFEMSAFFSFGKTYMVLDDEPDFYYEGYFSINNVKSDKLNSTITVNYSLFPYKWVINKYTDKWLWDPFNFKNGVIQYSYTNTDVGESFSINKDMDHQDKYLFIHAHLGSVIKISLSLENDSDFNLTGGFNFFSAPEPTLSVNVMNFKTLGIFNPYELKKGENVYYIYLSPQLNTTKYLLFNSINYENNDIYFMAHFIFFPRSETNNIGKFDVMEGVL